MEAAQGPKARNKKPIALCSLKVRKPNEKVKGHYRGVMSLPS